jgi:HSP20 family protein
MSHDRVRTMRLLFASTEPPRPVGWQPAADVYRTRRGWLVKLDLAGVRPGDVELVAHGNCLTIRGHRRDCSLEEGCHCYRLEITYDRFERTLELPCNLDHAHVTAEHHEGMLLVRIQTEEASL